MNDPATTTATSPSRIFSRLGGAARVWLLVGVLSAAAFVLNEAVVRHVEEPEMKLRIPWYLLAGLFYLVEANVIHLHFRREAHSISFSEIPMVLALFFASPRTVVLAVLLGSAAALLIHRRQRPLKLAFNLATFALNATVVVSVFGITTRAAASGLSPRCWGATFLAVGTGAVLSIILVSAAISLAEGRVSVSGLSNVASVALAGAFANASLALVAVEILVRNPDALALLLAPCAAGALAFRAYSSQRQRHEHLEFLYDTMRATQAAPELEGAVRELLVAARRTFKAEVAEAVLTLPEDTRVVRSILSNDGEWLMQTTSPTDAEVSALAQLQSGSLLLGRPKPGRPTPEYLTERGFRDAIVTALRGENRIIGALVIANRSSDVSTFTDDDRRLFEAFAAHAAVLLENDRLEQSIAELTELKEQLHHQALHDSLTGLPNRRLMLELANDALAAAGPGQSPPTMLFLDLDDFKTVNDSLGHLAGDELLTAVGKRLNETLRPEDTAARLGGDEFAVLVRSATSDDAMRVARRLLARLDAPFTIGRHEVSVRATVGIAMAGPEVTSAQDLLRNADLAMYAAKGVSKQRYVLYRNELKTRVRKRHELVAALERAADDGEISVHYQPIVTLKTGRITAFEALVRWERPGQGLMYPSDFLNLAEETGLVVPIGRRVLADACRQIREWQTTMPLPEDFAVTVNLSARELQDPRLVKETALLLGENELNARNLIFEITESSAMSDPETILATMHELRRLGVRLALDDFGTGYSSLSHLCDFPIDLIKIGKPFVDRLGAEGAGGPFTHAIFRFADSLSLDVVAEGIEQPEQVGSLRDLNCRLGQGFHFSRPMAAPAAETFLRGVFDMKARRAA